MMGISLLYKRFRWQINSSKNGCAALARLRLLDTCTASCITSALAQLWLLLSFGSCSALALAQLWLLLSFGSCTASAQAWLQLKLGYSISKASAQARLPLKQGFRSS
jgi:hypothetical protein